MAEKQGVPPSVYKNAIDLNRYSNSVAKKLVRNYNRIVLDATKELMAMDAQEYAASYRAHRLRMILGSLKTSLDGWAGDASKLMKGELTDLAHVEAEFATAQLLLQIPGSGELIKELTISPQFAQAVVETDPTALNQIVLSDRLEEKVLPGSRDTFQLGAKQGATISLPNGQPLGRALRGIATSSADKFRMVIQDGLLIGDSMDKMVRKIVGSQGGMRFASEAVNVRQLAQAGGQVTALANHQIMTLVRTSVTQVSNVATQETYKANREITDNFIFVATLDSRTSLTCATKDGKEYSYDDGPIPPLHFNCRSTTVAVPNWKRLKKEYGIEPPDEPALRASKDGPVPAGETYGNWLYDKRLKTPEGKYLGPGPEQIEALGKKKAIYFNRLAARKGSNGDIAIRKLISTDGTEKTLNQIVKENKLRPITALKERTKPLGLGSQKTKDEELPTMGGLQGMAAENRIQSKDVARAFDLLETDMDEASEGAKKLGQFVRQRQIFASWQTSGRQSLQHLIGNKQLEKSMVLGLARGTKGVSKANKLRTQMGLTRVKNILKEIKQGKPGSTMKGSLGLMGSKSGVQGFTIQGSNQIVMRAHSYDRPLTSKGLLEVRNAVRRSIVASHQGKPLEHATEGLWRLTKNKESIEAPLNWISTFIHELGHQVHFAAGRPKLTWDGARVLKDSLDTEVLAGTWIPSKYGQKNIMEQFAETFVQYIFDPVALKDAAPEAYKWVDDAMNAALKAPI